MNFGIIPDRGLRASRVNWKLIKGLSVKSMCRGSLLRGRQFVSVAIIISTLPRARIIVHKISKIMNNCNRILNVRSPLDSTVESSARARRERFPRRAVIARPFAPRVILKMNVIM